MFNYKNVKIDVKSRKKILLSDILNKPPTECRKGMKNVGISRLSVLQREAMFCLFCRNYSKS